MTVQQTTAAASTGAAVCGNTLDRADLTALAERASWFEERLSQAYTALEGEAADSIRERRLNRWRSNVAEGDEARFRRRLEWDGLTPAQLHKALGPVRLRDSAELPSWTVTLSELLAEADLSWATPTDKAGERFLSPSAPLPFEDVMRPLVVAASRRLQTCCGQDLEHFSDAALGAIERTLVRRISMFLSDTLHLEFKLFRRRRISPLGLVVQRMAGPPPGTVYREFVRHLLRGGLRTVLLDYPVLGRLIATTCSFWVAAAAELVSRYAADREGIGRLLGLEEAPGGVVRVEGLLSDSHHGGRSVSILTLDSGRRVVYKPRPITNERAWFDLVGWLNEHGAPEQLRRLRVLERPGYGWVEAITAGPLADRAAAARFYRRCGALLALTYALGSSDMHFENLIAEGDQPVLIDLETVLSHAPVALIDGSRADEPLRIVGFESVTRTGLLPRWQTTLGEVVDVSALGAVDRQRSRVPVTRWAHVNTDWMEPAYETPTGVPGPNAPTLEGRTLSPNDHADDLVAGFREMYRLLVREREHLLAPGGPVDALRGLSVRFVFRATALYLATLKGSRPPHLLRDGADRSLFLDCLSAPLLHGRNKPAAWALLGPERRALENEDCPHFTAAAAGAVIEGPVATAIDGVLEGPCFDRAAARLRRMGRTDLDQQISLVLASLEARLEPARHAAGPAPARPGEPRRPDVEADATPGPEPAEPTGADLVDGAVKIGDALLAAALSGAGDAPSWLTLRYLPGAAKNQLDVVGADLFDGRAGIALALAALYRVTGRPRYLRPVRAIAEAIDEELDRLSPQSPPPDVLLHGLTGIAGLAYALPHVAELTGEARLGTAAEHAMGFLTDAAIDADTHFDVLSGTAGSILCLLRLARVGVPAALERAVACGEHLLRNRITQSGGPRCWSTFEGRPITGLAHGNAGIAFALLRLFAATGDERFRAAAVEGIAFENTTLSRRTGNWPDLRWSQPSFAAGWCHGGPGIALTRLAARAYLDGGEYERDIELGVQVARTAVLDGPDHLCCGNLGRLLVLQDIARSGHHRQELEQIVSVLTARVVGAAAQRGSFGLVRPGRGLVTYPSLFQGTAGFAYALLRLAEPELVPSVVSLE